MDLARKLLSIHADFNSEPFVSLDELLRKMPIYNSGSIKFKSSCTVRVCIYTHFKFPGVFLSNIAYKLKIQFSDVLHWALAMVNLCPFLKTFYIQAFWILQLGSKVWTN